MSTIPNILNERELLRAKKELARLMATQGNDFLLNLLQDGTAPEVIELQRNGIKSSIDHIQNDISDFEFLKNQSSFFYDNISGLDIGKLPIVFRVISGLSQKDFADKLGVKEQQIQRYEAEFFSSMKLGTFLDLLEKLNIQISARGKSNRDFKSDRNLEFNLTKSSYKYIRYNNWFGENTNEYSDEEIGKLARDLVYSSAKNSSTRALFKAGRENSKKNKSAEEQLWISQIIARALERKDGVGCKFDFLRIDYIPEILSLSNISNGPIQAIERLNDLGLIVVVLPGFPGMAIDGAAIVVEGIPVIALSIRHDRIDSFWYTLLHELGHIHLHHSKGLDRGFFDNFDIDDNAPLEEEANHFASELIISSEKWKTSPARLSKSSESISKLAKRLNIHEALLFGKIRRERGYNLFSDKIGQGKVRNLFVKTPQDHSL